MARVTDSRDGVPRMTITIPVRLGREEIASGLCAAAVNDRIPGLDVVWFDEPGAVDALPDRIGRDRVLTGIRDVISQFGADVLSFWTDDVDDPDTADDLKDWAARITDRAFPEFAPYPRKD